jgi:hypothetical protein
MSSISRVASVLAVGFAVTFSGLASAHDYTKDGSVAAQPVEAFAMREGKAISPVQSNAKLAIYIKPGFIVRAKNVASVVTTGTGRYCIKPTTSAGINLSQIVPVVSVEWGASLASASDEMFAYYLASASSCPSGTIAVLTFDGNGGAPLLSSGVAFTLIVQ